MDEKKRDSASNLSQALKKVNAIEIYYAKIICMTSGSTRLKIYRKIASLMSNRFSLMNALDMLHATITNDGKNPSEPLANRLPNGATDCRTVCRSPMRSKAGRRTANG